MVNPTVQQLEAEVKQEDAEIAALEAALKKECVGLVAHPLTTGSARISMAPWGHVVSLSALPLTTKRAREK